MSAKGVFVDTLVQIEAVQVVHIEARFALFWQFVFQMDAIASNSKSFQNGGYFTVAQHFLLWSFLSLC